MKSYLVTMTLLTGLFSAACIAGDNTPLNQKARRAGEDIRRAVEDAYNKNAPDPVRKAADKAKDAAQNAGKAAKQFKKGLTGK